MRCILFLLSLVLGIGVNVSAQEAKHVKVLAVGNSFSQDATTYLPQIVKGSTKPGVLILEKATIGGCDLQRHLRHIAAYEKNPDDPEGKPYQRKTKSLKELLTADTWDFVTIQQVSTKSFKPATYRPHARELMEYIKKYAPQAEVVLHQTWTYRADEPRFGTAFCESQDAMYQGLCQAYAGIAAELGLRIIRSGDAMEWARRSPDWGGVFPIPGFDKTQYVYPDLPDQSRSLHTGYHWKKEDGHWVLKYDGIHANPAGDYLTGCVWFEFFFGISPVGNTFVPKPLKAEDAKILQRIAHEVVELPYGLTK